MLRCGNCRLLPQAVISRAEIPRRSGLATYRAAPSRDLMKRRLSVAAPSTPAINSGVTNDLGL
jgi:hypothetical protein